MACPLITTFPEGTARNKALAVWGGVGGLGATAALLIGGLLTDLLGWEWISFLNLPVTAVLLVAAPALLWESRDTTVSRRFDVPGAVTLTGALVLVCAVIARGPEAGWTSVQTLVLAAAAVVLAVAFCWIKSRTPSPLVPLGVFRSRSLVGGNAVVL
ncbi:MFS transporter [Saccharopolyspora sp. WRP15-2]|uniref:MFS transporter n=1 Tax=Saccharopolyspora oryzae TaxID=2997343 RepID=A0ABT4V2K6_9PSEU|nr:MFS transporter [Saccharopolyspora oryzae]MDA3628195.1 MFS transporter [Saccharopolyspora oryzae]